jgi:hypothetical protein
VTTDGETLAEVVRDARDALEWALRQLPRVGGEPWAVLARLNALVFPELAAAPARPCVTGEYVVTTTGPAGAVFLDVVPPPPFQRVALELTADRARALTRVLLEAASLAGQGSTS